MAFSSRESIYQWMLTTPDKHQSHIAQDTAHATAVRPDSRPDRAPGELDIPRMVQGATLGKRTRDPSTRTQRNGRVPSSKTPRNEYERRPRHKTREDRYDYKPSVSRSKKQSRQGTTKRVRRGRKEAMIDWFHASNVARERLTLRQHANVGIFSKGRASSPIKVRVGPNSAFSENGFLSKKNPPLHELRSAKDTTGRRHKGSKRSSQYDAVEEASRRVISASPKPSESAAARLDPYIADHRQYPSSLGRTSKVDEQREPAVPQPQHTSSELEGQMRGPGEVSRSATLCGWFESPPRKTRLESALELQLLDMLHAGLSPDKDPDRKDQEHPEKSYCNLEGLKSMLEARKAQWGSEVDDDGPDHRGSLDAGSTRERKPRANIKDKSAIIQPPSFDFTDSPDGEPITLDRGLPMKTSQRSQCPNERTSHPSYTSHYADVDTLAMGQDLTDDEVFYRHLDEAFHQIMEPGSSIHSSRERKQRTPVRRHSSRIKTGHLSPAPRNHSLRRGSFDIPSYHQPLFDTFNLMPDSIAQHTLTQERSVDPSTLHDHSVSRLLTFEDLNANALSSTRSRQLFNPDFDKYPGGFWRQNRLY